MKKYRAFTLLEMLIVMGILIILIGLAVIVARFSIYRARVIHYKNAVLQLEKALILFRNDNKYIPMIGDCHSCIEEEFFAYSLGYKGDKSVLRGYLEVFPFDGGNDTTYYYATDITGNYFMVCVAYGGIDDHAELGYHCSGTAMGLDLYGPEGSIGRITTHDIDPNDLDLVRTVNGMDKSDWYLKGGFASPG